MDNFKFKNTICQCLTLVPFEKLPIFSIYQNDLGMKKLLTIPLLKVFIAAELKGWRSYREIEEGLLADKQLCKELEITSISGSQLSRRIAHVPTELLQELFVQMVGNVQPLCEGLSGISGTIGKLKIVDSSKLALPAAVCEWAKVKKDWTGVKVHVRLSVDNPKTTYPDKIVPSLGIVDDRRGAVALVVEDDATYVMDRGYVEYDLMDKWDADGIRYVIRMYANSKETIIEEYNVSPNSNVVRDAKVKFGSKAAWMERVIRLVEFLDEKGKLYRIATNRWDLSAEEIAEIYKNRWLIELFFKWIKQHLPATKIHCTSPQGIWNEIYIAMITYLLSMYIYLTTETRKTPWDILSMIRIYVEKAWNTFKKALKRKPSRTSRGRQKSSRPRERPLDLTSGVALISNNKE